MPEAEGWNEPVTASDDTVEEVAGLCKGEGERGRGKWGGLVVHTRQLPPSFHSSEAALVGGKQHGERTWGDGREG